MNYKKQIKEKGLKQSFLAKQIGVTESYFSLALNGKTKFSEKRKEQLNQLLK